jgi:hypothetical protein
MDYRLIVLGSSGKPTRTEIWTCANDEEALARAAGYGAGYGAELWEADRHVSTFAGQLTPAGERGQTVA